MASSHQANRMAASRPLVSLALLLAGLTSFWLAGRLPHRVVNIQPVHAASLSPVSETSSRAKPIEEIRVGDYVLSQDPVTGQVARKQVLRTFEHRSDHVLRLTIGCGDRFETIQTTVDHPFWSVDREDFVEAGDLSIGSRFHAFDGRPATLTATEYEARPDGVTVYNFEVEAFHTYFVGPSSDSFVLVHNKPMRARQPQSASESLPQLKGRSEHQIRKILQDAGFRRTRVSNSAARNEIWVHSDGSEVRIHPYGNVNQSPYRSANNAHVHRQDPLGNQLNDRGLPSTIPADIHIGIPNPPDLPVVRGRPHGA